MLNKTWSHTLKWLHFPSDAADNVAVTKQEEVLDVKVNNCEESLPVSAVLLRFSTFKMSLVIFLMVCRASSLNLPTPYRTTKRWLHSWLLLSSWKDKEKQQIWRRDERINQTSTDDPNYLNQFKIGQLIYNMMTM